MTSPAVKLLGAKTAAAAGGGTWDTAATTLGSIGYNASGTTIVITSGAAAAIGDIVIVRAAWDNDADSYSPTATVADSNGNSWTLLANGYYNSSNLAATGVCSGIWGSVLTTAIASSDTITVTLSGAIVARVGFAHKFTGGTTITESRADVTVGASTSTPSSGATTGHASGDLIVCMCGIERRNDPGPTFDSDTTEGSWQTGEYLRAGPTSTADIMVACQHKVTTGTSAQTWNLTWPNGGDTMTISVALTP